MNWKIKYTKYHYQTMPMKLSELKGNYTIWEYSYIVAGLLKCCKLQIFQEKNISQTGFENFGKVHASKMSYVNLNIFVNSSEIKTLTFLDFPRT